MLSLLCPKLTNVDFGYDGLMQIFCLCIVLVGSVVTMGQYDETFCWKKQ
jgi:hypothetical protein